jgi:hypothetical protein
MDLFDKKQMSLSLYFVEQDLLRSTKTDNLVADARSERPRRTALAARCRVLLPAGVCPSRGSKPETVFVPAVCYIARRSPSSFGAFGVRTCRSVPLSVRVSPFASYVAHRWSPLSSVIAEAEAAAEVLEVGIESQGSVVVEVH